MVKLCVCVFMCAAGSPGQDSDKPGTSMVEIQCLLDSVGATELVIDLIVSTKNDRVFEESILLGIALLCGGNTQIQVCTPYTRIYSRYALWVSYFMKELVIMHPISIHLLSPCRIPSIISCTSRRSQRSSLKFSTTTCSWLRRRSAPPSLSTCLRSAVGSTRRKEKFPASDREKVEWLNCESINNDNN